MALMEIRIKLRLGTQSSNQQQQQQNPCFVLWNCPSSMSAKKIKSVLISKEFSLIIVLARRERDNEGITLSKMLQRIYIMLTSFNSIYIIHIRSVNTSITNIMENQAT